MNIILNITRTDDPSPRDEVWILMSQIFGEFFLRYQQGRNEPDLLANDTRPTNIINNPL